LPPAYPTIDPNPFLHPCASQIEDVEEAIRLTHMSKASLADAGGAAHGDGDDSTRIFTVLRDAAVAANVTSLDLSGVEAAVLHRGFTKEAFFLCLEEYTDLNVIVVDAARTRIDFIG